MNESELDDSDDELEDGMILRSNRVKRLRVGAKVLTTEDEQFIEDENNISDDDEELEGFSNDDLTIRNLTNANGSICDQWKWTAKEEIKWKHASVKPPLFEFVPIICDEMFEDIPSPLDYFTKYVPESLFKDMVYYTNLYAEQNEVKKWKPTDESEMQKFIGLHVWMGNLRFPRIEMYYQRELQMKIFTDSIPLYRFYQLRTNFHLIDVLAISPECTDKFVRVRPLMNSVRNRCLELPLEEYLAVDEQMIPCRGRLTKGVKQYVKMKPKIKWGIKNQVLSGKSGLAYDFICYQGDSTEFDRTILANFGLGATVVLHLTNRINRSGHKLFFDNYFSTFPLYQILAQKKIYAAGTIRIDRFAKPPFKSDADMRKMGRGSSDEIVSSDGTVTCIKWYDNKCVALASNFVGIGKTDKAERYDKAKNCKISIERPEIVQNYNLNMGGVDLMNQMVAYYRIFVRSKKWTLRVISHFIDFAIVNSWIEYKMDCERSQILKKERMDLLAFRMKLADQLVRTPTTARRSTRLAPDDQADSKKTVRDKEYRTDKRVRYDDQGHYPEYSKTRLRCKLETCNLKSQMVCRKCKVHLCLNRNNNCFTAYHTK